MMTAFLASLEGGFVDEASIESKTISTDERARSASIAARVSKLVSGFLDAEGKGELTKKIADSLESQYKSTVRFPNAALFVKLRDLLIEQGVIKPLRLQENFRALKTGDLVEFQGIASPNPLYQLRRAFNQLLPLFEPIKEIEVNQAEQQIAFLRTASIGQSYKESDQEIIFESQEQIDTLITFLQAKQNVARSEISTFHSVGKVLSGLFPQNELDTLVFQAEQFDAVVHVYPAFARNERLQDILAGEWLCIGKVIGVIEESDSYDLMKDSPITYVKNAFLSLVGGLKNEDLNIETSNPEVEGPAVIVAALAIFA